MFDARRPAVAVALATLLLVAASAVGATATQEDPATGQSHESRTATRVFSLKYANPEKVAQVVEIFGGAFRPDPELGVLGWTGPAVMAEALEAAIARLDVPPAPTRNLEITAHLLGVSRGAAKSTALPDELLGVAEQLRSLLRFDSIRLLDTLVVRLRDGSRGKEVNGILAGERGTLPYSLRIGKVALTADGESQQARLDDVRFVMVIPAAGSASGEKGEGRTETVRIDTDIDVRPGVKAVVGKASVSGPDDAVVLVIQVVAVD